MRAHSSTVLRRAARLGLHAGILLLAWGVALPVRAEDLSLLVKHGTVAGRVERTGLGLRFGPLWSVTWGRWQAALLPELEISRFRYTGSAPAPHHLDEVGALGVLHLTRHGDGVQPYVEAGLGGALLSHDTLGSKTFSTHFQFSEHVGAGVNLSARTALGWQFSHYSNADIRLPNDGLDVHQIVLSVRF